MIRATVDKLSGNLVITADNYSRSDLTCEYACGGYPRAEDCVVDLLRGAGIEWVRPEEVGALTDAPIFTDDLDIEDDGTQKVLGAVWWYPDYQVLDPWAELKNKGRVIFQLAEEG